MKSADHDRVTEADVAAEKSIIEYIRRFYPDHNFICEEGDYVRTESPFTWIIDPLDGTINYLKSIPHFAVSIGVEKNGVLLAGVVYDTMKDEMFYAEKDKGAFLNDMQIHVSSVGSLSDALVYTGFYYNRGKEMRETLSQIEGFFADGVLAVRRSGSAAVDLCWVACGRGDGFWEHQLSVWDFAGALCILQESGAKCTDYSGDPLPLQGSSLIVSNGNIHDEMMDVISRTSL